jgi:hypothetical protein
MALYSYSYYSYFYSYIITIIINSLLMSPLLGIGLPYGSHIRRTCHNPSREPSADWWVLKLQMQPGHTT